MAAVLTRMKYPIWQSRNKVELIIEVWEHLDCESVGATELEAIQRVLQERFGEGAVDSPATIARLLAEEGAVLRHPEIIDFDSSWRRRILAADAGELNFDSLAAAAVSMAQLERSRKEFEANADTVRLRLLREFVADQSAELLFLATNRTSSQRAKSEAREIAQWFAVWRQTPELFVDWLELRLTSPDFRSLFPDFQPREQSG